MIPVTTDLLTDRLAGCTLTGAVQMPNNAGVGLLFDNGLVFAVRIGFLLDDEESEGVREVVRRSLVREAATLAALGEPIIDALTSGEMTVNKARTLVREAYGLEPPTMTFLPKQTVAESEGTLDAAHATKRQRAHELLERTTPDV